MEALYDRDASHEVALRNLLQRKGYESLESVQREAKDEGNRAATARSVVKVLERRGIAVDAAERQRIESCTELEVLER